MRALLFAVLTLLAVLSNRVLGDWEKRAAAPQEISLTLPLSDDIAASAGLETNPDVEKVILAGFFSDWDPADEHFAMQRTATNRWSIHLAFEPGDNRYKFVIYQKGDPTPHWLPDSRAKIQVPDSFGGLNSVIRIPDYRTWAWFVNAILLGLLAILVLYSLLEPGFHWLLHLKLGFRFKLLLCVVFIGILSNIGFIVNNVLENREIVRQGVLDGVNLIHNFLIGEGVDFGRDMKGDGVKKSAEAVRKFFATARTRVEKSKHSNIQITISDLLLLDPDFRVVWYIPRKENAALQESRARTYRFSSPADYFRYGLLSNLVEAAKADPSRRVFRTGKPNPVLMRKETPQTQTDLAFLGWNAWLYPIVVRNQLVGYYAGDIQVKLYGAEILRALLFNLYLVAVTSALVVMLLLFVGRLLTENLMLLTGWTGKIIRGDFNTEEKINSNDEIQLLAENFNQMRISLRNSFQLIEENNRRLLVEAYVDRITGLKNRKRLFTDLESREDRSMILMNIDSFQETNDFFGNEVGDYILQEMGKRIESLILKDDVHLYKIGADEYVILFDRFMESRELEVMAVYFCDGVMEHSYRTMDNEIYVSVTAGMAGYDAAKEAENPKNHPRILLSRADMALKKAKHSQRRNLCYDGSMEITREYELNILWTQKLKNALREGRVVPYFQPIVSNKSGLVEKYECLVRMIEPDGSVISPQSFLKISKKARFYRFITKTMVEKSMAAFRDTPYEFAVNLSIEDIIDDKTQEFIWNSLRHNLETAKRMVFEIVETEGIENYEIVRDFIRHIRSFGCKVAIDDFGSGYSNFEHILQLNVDYIKIDAALIRNMDTSESSQIITRTISRFAGDLGIRTIAEYVHSSDIRDKAVEYGIDFSQGYFFGEPKPKIL